MWQIRRQVRFTSWVEKSAPVLAGVRGAARSEREDFLLFIFFFLRRGRMNFFFPKATTTQPCSSYFGNPSAISSVATELEDN